MIGEADEVSMVATDYWTETNIADGLNALAICLEVPPLPISFSPHQC